MTSAKKKRACSLARSRSSQPRVCYLWWQRNPARKVPRAGKWHNVRVLPWGANHHHMFELFNRSFECAWPPLEVQIGHLDLIWLLLKRSNRKNETCPARHARHWTCSSERSSHTHELVLPGVEIKHLSLSLSRFHIGSFSVLLQVLTIVDSN